MVAEGVRWLRYPDAGRSRHALLFVCGSLAVHELCRVLLAREGRRRVACRVCGRWSPRERHATRYVRRREAVGNARVRARGSKWQPDPRGPVEHEGDMID